MTLRRNMSARGLLALGILSAFYLTASVTPTAVAQAPQPAATPGLPAGVERVTSVEGITEYRLANGLQVLLFPDPTKETITVNVTYLVGSSHENYGETGMAHLLEHLVFKGTPRHPNIAQELTEHGSPPERHDLDRPHELLRDVRRDRRQPRVGARSRSRPDGQLVHRQEGSRQRNDRRPQRVRGGREQSVRRAAAARRWRAPICGTTTARPPSARGPISRMCRSSACRRSTRSYYQPDNAVLLVAGSSTSRRRSPSFTSTFRRSRVPTRVLDRTYTVEPTQDGERSVTLRRVGDTQFVSALYHVPSGAHEEFGAIDIVSQVLGDTPSGRLHKALVEAKKASSIFGFGFQWREPIARVVRRRGARRVLARRRQGHAPRDHRRIGAQRRRPRRKSSAHGRSCSKRSS